MGIREFSRSLEPFAGLAGRCALKAESLCRSESAATSVETAAVLSVMLGLLVPVFLSILPKLGFDDRTRILAGFDQEHAAAHLVQEMTLEGQLKLAGSCDMTATLADIAQRLHDFSGLSGYCSVVLESSIDSVGGITTQILDSSDAVGSTCITDINDVPGFQASIEKSLNLDLQRVQLSLGSFIQTSSGENLFSVQNIATTPASQNPSEQTASGSCACIGGLC